MADKDKSVIDRMLVRLSHLDRLLSLVGEVIITSNSIANTNRKIQERYDRNEPLDKVSMDMIKIAEESSNRISSDLHSLVMDIRMVEIRGTFQRFRRAVRDMAKEAAKDVELELVGEDTLVDKTIAEKLYDPLNHQVRNAIDHGIEDPLERQRLGKPVKGRLTLKAQMRENFIYIEVTDNGRGVDPDVVVSQAVKRGLVSEAEGAALTEEEKLGFIFHPGFSTKTTASKISGRGVGMDVVKSNIEELGGEVSIRTRFGEGTTFIYKIPQVTAVNILDCLTVRAGENLFAIPILNVVSTLRLPESKVHVTFEKGRSITYLGSIVTLYDVNELLGDPPLEEEEENVIVIVEAKNGRIALRVTELLTPEKLVYTPLASIFSVQGISGVTMMGGSRMGLIIDVQEIIDRSRGAVEEDEAQPEKPSAIALKKEAEPPETAEKAAEPEKQPKKDVLTLSSDIGREISHREEFLMELEEMVNNAGEEILSLEANPSDTDLLNKIFRDFHSMKGNIMMVGLAELGSFIHDIEAILDKARGGDLDVTSEIIDILLDSTDVIKQAKQAMVDGQAPEIDKALMETIKKYQAPREEKKADVVDVHQRTFHLESLEKFNLLARRHSGHYVYQVFLSFRSEYQQAFLVALLMLRRISNIGHIFGTIPTVDEIQEQNISDQLKIMFSSNKNEEELKEFIENTLVRYYDVKEYEILKTF